MKEYLPGDGRWLWLILLTRNRRQPYRNLTLTFYSFCWKITDSTNEPIFRWNIVSMHALRQASQSFKMDYTQHKCTTLQYQNLTTVLYNRVTHFQLKST